MAYPRTEVLQRRREVTTLLVRGVSPGEIAERLGVRRRTIYNDIRAVRSGRNEALVAHSRREIVAQLYLNAQARSRYLWNLADTAKSEYVMVRVMHELRLNDEHFTKVLPAIRTPAQERAAAAKEKQQEARRASDTEAIQAILDRNRRRLRVSEGLPPLTPAERKAGVGVKKSSGVEKNTMPGRRKSVVKANPGDSSGSTMPEGVVKDGVAADAANPGTLEQLAAEANRISAGLIKLGAQIEALEAAESGIPKPRPSGRG